MLRSLLLNTLLLLSYVTTANTTVVKDILELTKANGSWMDYDVVDGRVIKY